MKKYKLKTEANPNKLYEGFPKKRKIQEEGDTFFNTYIMYALDYMEKRFKVSFDDFKLAKKFEDEEMAYLYTCDIEAKQLGVLSLTFKNCGLAIRTTLLSKNKLCVKFELRWETYVGERDGSPIGKLIVDMPSKKTSWKDGE